MRRVVAAALARSRPWSRVALDRLADAGGAAGAVYPHQSLGNRGADVAGASRASSRHRGDGPSRSMASSAPRPSTAVRRFQPAPGLPVTGTVDEPTWARLVVRVRVGTRGDGRPGPPAGAQREARRRAGRRRRLRTPHAGRGPRLPEALGIGGRPASHGPLTWRLPDRPLRAARASARHGCVTTRSGTAGQLGHGGGRSASSRRPRRAWSALGHGRMAVGDIGSSTAATSAATRRTSDGLDVDIRLMRKRQGPVPVGRNCRSSTYDRAATRDARQGHPGARRRAHQAHLLQRPGAHPRGSDDVVRRPRRPPPRPLLREDPPVAAYDC